MAKTIDLIGLKFNRLLVLERNGSTKNHKAIWLCLCDCGNKKSIASTSLIRGLSQSCGCVKSVRIGNLNRTHGYSKKIPEYTAWCGMKQRCYNPNYRMYNRYGGRGIKVCDEWLNDFEAFFKYIGKKPSANHSLDRFPNQDGNYEPGNIRWATQYEQLSNFNRNVYITYNGETKILAEWARNFGVNPEAINYHLKKGILFDKIAAHYINGYKNKKKSPMFL